MKATKLSGITYEEMADHLADEEFVILDEYLSPAEVEELVHAFAKHRQEDNFHRAGIGNAHHFQVDKQIRGDYIKWINPEEALPVAKEFLDRIEELMQSLSRYLFLSLRDFECHYAIYPPGTFYEKHLDQFKSTNNRKISFACYLNRRWKRGDGGELRLYLGDETLDVEPLAGRLALFRSDTVPHEVLSTNKDRYSITGWMCDRPVDLPFYRIR
ncbi:MAG: 2OG-Fe(II) oxygenase [Owenweeksia sp.]|nr:2OG-Fe(II) oxygenase [Owenweeksia sp.]